MSNPTVSVILPVYNGEQYLRFAIESVLNQTFQDYELIIIDDGSVDSTPAIAVEYGQRVRYVRQANTGVAGAFNHGLRLATGRYVSWLSHDDAFLSDKLEQQVNVISQVAAPSVCYTDIQMIDSLGCVVFEQKLPEYSRQHAFRQVLTGGQICLASYSILYDRRCLEEVGVYAEALRYAQDVDMLARLAQRFLLIHVPLPLMQVREHETRAIRSKNWEQEVERFFRNRLAHHPIEDLFPDLGEDATMADRGRAFLSLGDSLARRPYPIYRIAYTEYRRALKECPSLVTHLLTRLVLLSMRELYEILLRAVKAFPLVHRMVRHVKWKSHPQCDKSGSRTLIKPNTHELL